MNEKLNIALIGGRSLVLKCILEKLLELPYEYSKITIYGSKSASLEPIIIKDKHFFITELNEQNIESFDYVFFSGNEAISMKYVPLFVLKGAKVIDNSSFYRFHEDGVLVGKGINDLDIYSDKKIFANPNCVTLMVGRVLKSIDEIYPLEKIVITTYQSASGMGNLALQDFLLESKVMLLDHIFTSNTFPDQYIKRKSPLSFNVLPIIGKVMDNGYTFEEEKIRNELLKLLPKRDLMIDVTSVRVPTKRGHAASIHLVLNDKFNLNKIKEKLENTEDIRIYNDYSELLNVINTDYIDVSRLRKSQDCDYGLNIFLTSDNLYLGASTNSIYIFRKLLENDKR